MKKKLNDGEREEYLIKIYLCYLRDSKIDLPKIGKIINVGFTEEYKKTNWSEIDFKKIENDQIQIKKLANKLKIDKTSSRYKADIKINNTYYSLKCTGYGKPAIVNHTNRIGWLNISKIIDKDITGLDKVINKYWKLRTKGDVSEDCPNSSEKSPFKNHKNIIKPYLDFFVFKGSGQGLSEFPAEKVLEFESWIDQKSWKIYSKEYIDKLWPNLYFCMRSTKGMPTDYNSFKDKKLISPWTRFFKGKTGEKKHRGALHVRVG